MCLAIPMEIVSIEGVTAKVAAGGISYEANISLVPQAVIGDFVLIHAGFAIELLDKTEAEERLKLFGEISIHDMQDS